LCLPKCLTTASIHHLSLHDALPICPPAGKRRTGGGPRRAGATGGPSAGFAGLPRSRPRRVSPLPGDEAGPFPQPPLLVLLDEPRVEADRALRDDRVPREEVPQGRLG